jgi:hypothetical protein
MCWFCGIPIMDAGLNQLRSEGWGIKNEDLAHLSPLAYSYINMLGCYQFHLFYLLDFCHNH